MANSYTLTILDTSGRVRSQERRSFNDLPNETFLGHVIHPDGSLNDHAALVLINSWNVKELRSAEAAGRTVHFIYFL